MLAQIDAISGIYTAFFPVIIYILLGTSRHVSMGKVNFEMKKGRLCLFLLQYVTNWAK